MNCLPTRSWWTSKVYCQPIWLGSQSKWYCTCTASFQHLDLSYSMTKVYGYSEAHTVVSGYGSDHLNLESRGTLIQWLFPLPSLLSSSWKRTNKLLRSDFIDSHSYHQTSRLSYHLWHHWLVHACPVIMWYKCLFIMFFSVIESVSGIICMLNSGMRMFSYAGNAYKIISAILILNISYNVPNTEEYSPRYY